MGALAYETGGLLIDHGWIRFLGSGHPKLPRGIASWNEEQTGSVGQAGYLLVADDAVGGFFVVNGGGLPGDPGSITYLSPFSGEWEDMGASYSQLLSWTLTGDLDEFYEGSRWKSWKEDVQALEGDRAFSFYPFLWAEGPPIDERTRVAVPVAELLGIARQNTGGS